MSKSKSFRKRFIKIHIELVYLIPILLVFTLSIPAILAQEIESNEIIPHRDLAISYIIGRDGSLTAKVGDDSFTVRIPQIANHFWQTIEKTIVNENITIIEYANGQNVITLTLNMTENILHFDLEGRLVDANLLSFQFSENTIRLGENRTGLKLANGGLFYFDWSDIGLKTEFIEGSRSLRVDIRSAPIFKIDPRIVLTNPDFETGDFTGWILDCTGGSQAVNSSVPINGTFSHRIISNAGSPGGLCSVEQGVDPDNEFFLRFQLRIELNEMSDGDVKDIAQISRGGSFRSKVRLIQNDTLGGLEFTIRFQDDAGSTTHHNFTFPVIEVETIYCIEFSYDRDNSAPDSGSVTAHVNNTQFMDLTIDNNGLTVPNEINSGQIATQNGGKMIWRNDDFYLDDAVRVANCPEGLIPPPPPPITIIVVDFFPLAPLMNLFFIVGGFLLVFNAKGRLEFQATGMFFFLASLLFISVPIYAIIDDTSSLSYVILNYPDGIRNNFVLINFVFIGLGLTSVIINNREKLGFRRR